ncbi:hypothetical protein AVEN_138439-1 [Araneus ventricosus]|uniref:Ionotropic glutamate receptor L-glutamate and glycine-binding domain-containing protein n=1 Tax=Araneus ventricosus TaxID=182803 RepID=A0A4Y2CD94_ARAVE|nr:hypothetical protein AVEN_138439-1 [Araneus ventricosus]
MKFPKFLRIAVNQIGGMCELGVDANGKLKFESGTERGFIQFLSEMFRFSYELVQPPDMSWGSPRSDGNWTGLIGMVQRGEADMAMCSVIITEEREKVVSFSREYDIQHMIFATRRPKNLPRIQSIILPFSFQIWLGVLCLLIIMPVLWKYLLKVKTDLGNYYMYALASLLKLSIDIKCGRSCGEYILLGTWFWIVAVISAGYGSVFLSFLTLPMKEDVIRDIPRLAKAVAKGSHKCYAFQGTSPVNSLVISSVEQMRELGASIRRNHWIIEPSVEAVKNLLEEKNVAVIGTSAFFLSQFPNELTLSKDFFFQARIGIALSKKFCCKKILDRKLLQMQQAGFYQEWSKRSRYSSFVKSNTSDSLTMESVQPIHVEELFGAIRLLAVGYTVACFVLATEIISSKFKYKL